MCCSHARISSLHVARHPHSNVVSSDSMMLIRNGECVLCVDAHVLDVMCVWQLSCVSRIHLLHMYIPINRLETKVVIRPVWQQDARAVTPTHATPVTSTQAPVAPVTAAVSDTGVMSGTGSINGQQQMELTDFLAQPAPTHGVASFKKPITSHLSTVHEMDMTHAHVTSDEDESQVISMEEALRAEPPHDTIISLRDALAQAPPTVDVVDVTPISSIRTQPHTEVDHLRTTQVDVSTVSTSSHSPTHQHVAVATSPIATSPSATSPSSQTRSVTPIAPISPRGDARPLSLVESESVLCAGITCVRYHASRAIPCHITYTPHVSRHHLICTCDGLSHELRLSDITDALTARRALQHDITSFRDVESSPYHTDDASRVASCVTLLCDVTTQRYDIELTSPLAMKTWLHALHVTTTYVHTLPTTPSHAAVTWSPNTPRHSAHDSNVAMPEITLASTSAHPQDHVCTSPPRDDASAVHTNSEHVSPQHTDATATHDKHDTSSTAASLKHGTDASKHETASSDTAAKPEPEQQHKVCWETMSLQHDLV